MVKMETERYENNFKWISLSNKGRFRIIEKAHKLIENEIKMFAHDQLAGHYLLFHDLVPHVNAKSESEKAASI